MHLEEGYYPVIPIHDELESAEGVGTKEKFWTRHNGVLCLVKFGRPTTGENWAEKIACELCTLLALPHAHYDLATCGNQQCVLSPSMVEVGGRLALANEIMSSSRVSPDGTKIYRQREHTVSRSIAALTRFTDASVSIPQFIGYLMLDAWIGNTDRHNENWGILRNGTQRLAKIAPTFDHASSLGRELTDEVRIERLKTKDERYSVAAFTAKARSALYAEQSDGRPLSPIDAFALAGKAKKDGQAFWMAKLEAISEVEFEEVVDRIHPSFITKSSADFAKQILKINREKILELKL